MRVTKSEAVERVGMKKHLLLCLFLFSFVHAMNQSLSPLIMQMAEENRSVSPNELGLLHIEGHTKHFKRNCSLCMCHPLSFLNPKMPRETLLLQYAMKEPLMLNGQKLQGQQNGARLKTAYEA